MHPRISIIICAFNAGEHLRHSVASALAQTYSSFEVILIDDGSTDNSVKHLPTELLRDKRLHIFIQRNTGKPAALNAGINKATGEYLALQDADDISSPDRISRQLAAFECNPALGISFCGHYLIWEDNNIAPVGIPVGRGESSVIIRNYGMPGLDPTMMFPRGIAQSFPFDEELPIVEGYDFVLRVGEKHPLTNIGECLYGYRIHSESITKKDPLKRTRMVAKLLRKTCERRGESMESRFPEFAEEGRFHRISSPLNDTLSHCAVSAKSSVLRGRRSDAIKLVLWMLAKWPFSKDTHKALVFAITPRVLLSHFLNSRRRPI